MGKGHSTSRTMELVAQSGSPDLQLGSSSAWPPQSSPNAGLLSKLCCQSSAASQKPTGRTGTSISSSAGLCSESFKSWGIFKRSIFKPRQCPRLCSWLLQTHCSWFDFTFWLETGTQFNPEKMETEGFKTEFIELPTALMPGGAF